MRTVTLGQSGPRVGAIGLGCFGMSGAYGPADESDSIRAIHAALDMGITLVDTGDFYGMGHNESLIGRALRGRRDEAVLSVKFGLLRAPDGTALGYDGRPRSVKNFLTYSLQRLGVDHVDIYRPARVDPDVPIEDTVGAIARLVEQGYVRHVGLSEAPLAAIRSACATTRICDVQLEYSLMSRGIEQEILPFLRDQGIGVTAYGVLSRGLLVGTRPDPGAAHDIRVARLPRFRPENVERNLRLAEALANVARSLDITPAQASIAWVMAQCDGVVPVIGARRVDRLQEATATLALELDAEAIAAIERAVPTDQVAGTRYDEPQMAHLSVA